MTEIRVSCLLDRYWDPATKSFSGTEYPGTLIEISTQSADDNSGGLFPVGIVLLDNNTLHSVPIEFIEKINE